MTPQRPMQLLNAGDLHAAMQLAETCLQANPSDAEALETLVKASTLQGDLASASRHLQQWLQCRPNDPAALASLGELYSRSGQLAKALQTYQQALLQHPEHIELLNGLTLTLIGSQQLEQAEVAWKKAHSLAPEHIDVQRNLGLLNRCKAPRWHFPMVNDDRRNDLFEQAIRKAVNKCKEKHPDQQCRVLDIGAGSGLLSMLAARAGATDITACESNPEMARIAQQIVSDNGFEARIRIVPKPSQALQVGSDLSERVDLILAEVFDSVVIGEGAVPTYEHALRELAREDCLTIPCRAEILAAMVSSEALWHEGAVDRASGFDLRAMNQLSPGMIGLESGSLPMQAVSDTVVLMAFDFSMASKPTPTVSRVRLSANRSAKVHAVVYWMRLWLDDELYLDNRPDLGDGQSVGFVEHWGPMAKLLRVTEALEPGTEWEVETHHNRRHVTLLIRDPETGRLLG